MGYTVLGGDFFDSTNAFAEPMTLWNKKEDKKTGRVYYDPRKHEMGKQLWREFSAISDRGGHKPRRDLVEYLFAGPEIAEQKRNSTGLCSWGGIRSAKVPP